MNRRNFLSSLGIIGASSLTLSQGFGSLLNPQKVAPIKINQPLEDTYPVHYQNFLRPDKIIAFGRIFGEIKPGSLVDKLVYQYGDFPRFKAHSDMNCPKTHQQLQSYEHEYGFEHSLMCSTFSSVLGLLNNWSQENWDVLIDNDWCNWNELEVYKMFIYEDLPFYVTDVCFNSHYGFVLNYLVTDTATKIRMNGYGGLWHNNRYHYRRWNGDPIMAKDWIPSPYFKECTCIDHNGLNQIDILHVDQLSTHGFAYDWMNTDVANCVFDTLGK